MSIKLGNNDISKIYLGSTEIEKIYQGDTAIYEGDEPTPPSPTDYSKQYFTIRALEDYTLVQFNNNDIEYSLDSGGTWNTLQSGGDISIMADEPVMFKASGLTPTSYKGIGSFVFYDAVEVEGNVMSLVNGDDFESATTVSAYQFVSLFNDQYGYFMNAENLVLPATTLANYCYQYMFRGSRITTAPVLPATTLARGCYNTMFASCTYLNSVTCLATDRSASQCTANWLSGVAANGTFTKAAGVTWPSGASGIPNGWTVVEV